MEKGPKLKVVAETPYGPRLEKEQLESNSEDVDSRERRDFLKRMAEIGVGVTAGVVLYKNFNPEKTEEASVDDGLSDVVEMEKKEETKSPEKIELSPRFENELLGYEAQVRLKRDEVLFVDEDNMPVGEPVFLEEFVGTRPGAGVGARADYLYLPGVKNVYGVLETSVSGDWLKRVREQQQSLFPKQKIKRVLHATADFRKAYHDPDEPDLIKKIREGEVTEYLDIVKYFADKSVFGVDDCTRKEYVSKEIKFLEDNKDEKRNVPPVVVTELRHLLPGLCAQESKFNNDLESASGARGIMQFMPDTWESYGGTMKDLDSFRQQVEIAGRFISDLYYQVQVHCGEGILNQVKNNFASEEDFQRDFLVPLIVNSYNAGSARMAEAVRLYMEARDKKIELPTGKDLFLAIADFAVVSNDGKYLKEYGTQAREYVSRIYAQAGELAKG